MLVTIQRIAALGKEWQRDPRRPKSMVPRRFLMALLISFPTREDRLRAIDILAEADETYQGVPSSCYLVSEAAGRLLEAKGVNFQVMGDRDKETVHAAGS
jgi:hypothetical protein